MRGLKPCGRQIYKDKKKCIYHLENKSDEEAKIFEIGFWEELKRRENDDAIKELDFSRYIFPERISFQDHLFEKSIIFEGAQFNNVDFIGAKFNNKAYFSHAQFNNVVQFSSAQFDNEVYFVQTQFNNEAYFLEVQFNNEANFGSAQFNNKTYFRFSKFDKPKVIRFLNIDLKNVSFVYTDVSEVEFLNVEWARKNGRLIVADETRIGKDNVTTYGEVAQLYRRLRRNYETNYRFAEAGEFFFGEMELRRHNVSTKFKNEKVKKIVLWFKGNFSFLGLYKHLSLYGESYIRPLMWSFIVVISYPMLMHWLFDASLPQSDDFPYTYLRTSAASFFQMDNTYIVERLIGFLLLGLLFIALKRQFERKK
ncbi:MAG: hypothetical protein A2W22_01765 [Candidatus Levybacteria bacterium RBG_16_35_11]|nr:MAG: hypothetical protein A2W22_01765 [Candidatus Levybacteria bacterium RBG_16_35_11]